MFFPAAQKVGHRASMRHYLRCQFNAEFNKNNDLLSKKALNSILEMNQRKQSRPRPYKAHFVTERPTFYRNEDIEPDFRFE